MSGEIWCIPKLLSLYSALWCCGLYSGWINKGNRFYLKAMHFVIRTFYYNNFCAIHQWNPVCRNIKACWENTGSFDNWVKVSVIYGIFIVTLHGNMQVPAEFLLDPLLLSGRYQCKCSDCVTYTFCKLLLAVRLSHSKWIILSFIFLNINCTEQMHSS